MEMHLRLNQMHTYHQKGLVIWMQRWRFCQHAVVVCVEDSDRDPEPRHRVQLLSHFALQGGELKGSKLLGVQGRDENLGVDWDVGQIIAKLDGAFENVEGVVERVEWHVQGRHGYSGGLWVVVCASCMCSCSSDTPAPWDVRSWRWTCRDAWCCGAWWSHTHHVRFTSRKCHDCSYLLSTVMLVRLATAGGSAGGWAGAHLHVPHHYFMICCCACVLFFEQLQCARKVVSAVFFNLLA